MFNSDLYVASTPIPYDYYSTSYGGGGGGYTTGAINNVVTYGGGGAGIASSGTSPTIYSVTGITPSLGSSGISLATGRWATASSTSYTPRSEFDSDIVIKRYNKPELKLGATLDLILDSLYIIIPDHKELDNNPALKSAYDHWQEKFNEHKQLMNPVKEAYDSYLMVQKLVKEETEE